MYSLKIDSAKVLFKSCPEAAHQLLETNEHTKTHTDTRTVAMLYPLRNKLREGITKTLEKGILAYDLDQKKEF
jgi:hypothetical protein